MLQVPQPVPKICQNRLTYVVSDILDTSHNILDFRVQTLVRILCKRNPVVEVGNTLAGARQRLPLPGCIFP